jgi:hypothetical protein
MEALIKAILDFGNIAIMVLMAGNLALWRMIDQVNGLRTQEQKEYRESMDKMSNALDRMTAVISELRVTIASRGH